MCVNLLRPVRFFSSFPPLKKKINRASNAVVSFVYCITYRRLNVWNKILPVFELIEWMRTEEETSSWEEKVSIVLHKRESISFLALDFGVKCKHQTFPTGFIYSEVTIRSISTSSTQSHRKESGLEYMFYKKWFVFPQRSLTLCLIQKVDELCAI